MWIDYSLFQPYTQARSMEVLMSDEQTLRREPPEPNAEERPARARLLHALLRLVAGPRQPEILIMERDGRLYRQPLR